MLQVQRFQTAPDATELGTAAADRSDRRAVTLTSDQNGRLIGVHCAASTELLAFPLGAAVRQGWPNVDATVDELHALLNRRAAAAGGRVAVTDMQKLAREAVYGGSGIRDRRAAEQARRQSPPATSIG